MSAEPEAFDDHARSLRRENGKRTPPSGRTYPCDALMASIPGELTFSINSRLLVGKASTGASDAEVVHRRPDLRSGS